MGVWLMPRPEVAVSVTVSVADNQLLAPLIDALHPLMLDDTIPGTVMIGNVLAVASATTPRSVWSDRPDLLEESDRRSVMDRFGVGWWNAKFGSYGSPAMAAARLAAVRAAVADLRGCSIVERSYPGAVTLQEAHPADRAQLGIPSLDLLRMAGWSGGEPAHTDFSLVCPPDGGRQPPARLSWSGGWSSRPGSTTSAGSPCSSATGSH